MRVKDVVLEMHQGINTVADKVEYVEYGIPIIQSKNFTKGYLDLENVRYLNKEDENKYIEKYSPHKADILLANIGTIGKSYVIKEEQKFLIAWNVFLIKPNRELVLSDFLKYYFDYLASTHYFEGLLTGGTVKFINKAKIGDIALPDINIDKQTQICNLLCAVEELIIKREKELQLLDELIKARFVEMFGHPEKNEKGWKMNTFGDICTVRQGLQIPISKRLTEYEEGCYEYITVQYLHGGKEREYIKNPKETVICNKDDILMTRTGNTGMVITGVDGVFHNNFFLIDFDRSKYDKDFLVQYLNLDMIQADILRRAGTSTIPDLNHGEFYKIQVFEPPMALQVEFNYVLKQVDKSKVVAIFLTVCKFTSIKKKVEVD